MECHQYFRLNGQPFQVASPRGAIYFSPTHLQALATLESGLSGDLIGLTLLTGEAGTGKTTLIYSLLQRDYKRVRIAHIDDPKLSFPEMMQSVLAQLNLYSAGSAKLDYLNTLEHLLERHGKEERIAIVIDESQLLSDEVLEEMRLLWNRGQSKGGYLRLILVGQPELAERLKKPELRALNQRISTRGVLKALTFEQANLYVECKLSAQGGKCSTVFEQGALGHLLRRSDGLPRKINVLCHSAMMTAFTAGERRVSVKTARKIAAEFKESVEVANREPASRRLAKPALTGGAAAIAMLVLFNLVYPNFRSGWALNHTASFDGAIEPTIPIKNVTGLKITGSSNVAGQHVSEVSSNGATAMLPHPMKLPPSSAAGGPTLPSAAVAIAKPPGASQVHSVPASSAEAPAADIANEVGSRKTQIMVKSGDTLEQIALRYLGSKAKISELIRANPQLSDINQLNVGQLIYLP
jgi:type II secretory pathway predicted ATPase ExeA/LysM repeat protein